MILLLVGTLQCSPQPAQSTKAEVEAFLSAVGAWAPAEGETGRAIERILATQFVDDGEVYRQIAETRPTHRRPFGPG